MSNVRQTNQDSQCTFNVILGRVRAAIVALENH